MLKAYLQKVPIYGVLIASLVGCASQIEEPKKFSTKAETASFCQCVKYMKNRSILKSDAKDAQDAGPYLIGYKQVPYPPKSGDIVIYNGKYGKGISSAGHIAEVISIRNNTDGSITITVKGANQKDPTFTEFKCNNVNKTMNSTISKSTSNISFYRK
ncbi:MAG: CHAP domain-containing protein [Candidatus Sericytochromatia bacterium]